MYVFIISRVDEAKYSSFLGLASDWAAKVMKPVKECPIILFSKALIKQP